MADYKRGDRVIYVGQDDENGARYRGDGRFYPEIGTIGVVYSTPNKGEPFDVDAIIQWPDGSTSGDDMWFCKYRFLEPCSQHELFDKADFTELDAFLNEMSDKKGVRK